MNAAKGTGFPWREPPVDAIVAEFMGRLLGISAYYHDSAAAVIENGRILAAAQEERFSRAKHDPRFPANAIRACLGESRVADLDAVVFYDKPLLTFDRLMETYFSFAPRGLRSFMAAMPAWAGGKLQLRRTIARELARLEGVRERSLPPILFGEHHESHAASAFYPSPFEKAAVLCMDGVGEWATTSAWIGDGSKLEPLWELRFPHSLGLLYSAFTYYTGFRVNSGEYKVMGLAPYGKPVYADRILTRLLDLKEDGSFGMDMRYFDYCAGSRMTSRRFDDLFGGPPRAPESPLTQREMDLARSIQVAVEEVLLRIARTLRRDTGAANLCLAGGVALNCVANGRLLRERVFDRIWIQPAAGDAGGALGCALAAYHRFLDFPRRTEATDSMSGALLGPAFSEDEVRGLLESEGARYERLEDESLFDAVAERLASEKVVGWVQGRMEFGPRALGNRSILGDARSSRMQSTMNLKIKYRESFRPFAPIVLAERAGEYFDLEVESPYMMLVAPVAEGQRRRTSAEEDTLRGMDLLKVARSTIPAVTHVDQSARVQTVDRGRNPRLYGLMKAFERRTGCGVLVNTSFNVRGEPIVCTPADAWRCFLRTEMDTLVLGNFVVDRSGVPRRLLDGASRGALGLD